MLKTNWIFALGMGLMAVGCGGGGTETPTPTGESPTEPAATATPADDGTVDVTFRVDTSGTITGPVSGTEEHLSAVADGEQVFIVGDFGTSGYTAWDPQNTGLAMTEESDGIYAITLSLIPGETIQYKYTKTSSDASNGWANGEKDFATMEERECSAEGAADAGGGLWEVANRSYTVPDTDVTNATDTVEAWRDYATNTYGYPSCD